MNCPLEIGRDPDVLVAYAAGRLSSEDTVRLELHMQGCGLCRKFSAEQKAVWQALDGWEAEPVATGFDQRLWARIEKEQQSAWWRFGSALRPAFLRPAFGAAAVCLIFVAGFLLREPIHFAQPVPQAQTEMVEAEQVERELEDVEMLREFNLVSAPEVVPIRSM